MSIPSIHRTGEITFFVLAGCEDLFLLPAVHPVEANFGIEMDIHLIDVNGGTSTRFAVTFGTMAAVTGQVREQSM
jgi:hypothetical protein